MEMARIRRLCQLPRIDFGCVGHSHVLALSVASLHYRPPNRLNNAWKRFAHRFVGDAPKAAYLQPITRAFTLYGGARISLGSCRRAWARVAMPAYRSDRSGAGGPI